MFNVEIERLGWGWEPIKFKTEGPLSPNTLNTF